MSLLTTLLGSAGGGSNSGSILTPVACASTVALTVTYANGTNGVGAKLTNAGAQAAISLDGISPTVGQRVLIKDQASGLQNGIYTVTTVGTGATNWVLTRATDFDEPTEMTAGVQVDIVGGTISGGTVWILSAAVTTVGTTAVTFVAASDAGYTASRALVTNAAGRVIVSGTSATEISYVTGVTSAIQAQLTALAGGSLRSQQVFTADGTWTRPAGITRVVVEVQGAGGGSGASSTSFPFATGGGGGGGYASEIIDVTSTSSTAVTVGVGGTAGTVNTGNGGAGGTSSFGAFTSATGGSGGGGASSTGAAPGVGSGGTLNLSGGYGQTPLLPGLSTAAPIGGAGGDSRLGFGGLGGVSDGTGTAGAVYGGGAGGSATSDSTASGGAIGAAGVVIVWEYS